MADFGFVFQLRMLLKQRGDDGLIPKQQKSIGWVTDDRECRTGDNNARAQIASHGIESYCQRACHYPAMSWALPNYSAKPLGILVSRENKGNQRGNNPYF
jgi:hypothetical protein